MTDLYIEYIPIDDLIKMERNPKLHSPDIDSSFSRYGYVDPVLIDETSGKLVAGHGRLEKLQERRDSGESPPERIKVEQGVWKVPVIRGVAFRTAEEAEEYGVTANALTIAGGFDETELEQLIEETGMEPFGLEEAEQLVTEIEGAISTSQTMLDLEDPTEDNIDIISPEEDNQKLVGDSEEPEAPREKKLDDQQIYDQLPFELEGVFELSEEAYFLPEEDSFSSKCIGAVNIVGEGWTDLPGANKMQVPQLRPDRLVQELPELKIWGDRLSTPDDGKSWYFFNYGAAPHRGLPFERTVMSFFTHDQHIETWWATPAYRTGQIIRAGVKNIIVPDFSLWDIAPTAAHIWSIYRSAWLGRYFQEAGLNVIPRLEFFQDKSKPYALLGIPYEAPIVATQFQTGFEEDRIPSIERDLKAALKILRPKKLLVYAGKKGREMISKFDLPCDLIVLKTSGELRKKEARKKETDPHLLELRKRKKGKEASRATTPNK